MKVCLLIEHFFQQDRICIINSSCRVNSRCADLLAVIKKATQKGSEANGDRERLQVKAGDREERPSEHKSILQIIHLHK